MQEQFDRSAGVLMPVSSLPGPYGIGTFGKKAYEFVDNLVKARQKYWQLLRQIKKSKKFIKKNHQLKK